MKSASTFERDNLCGAKLIVGYTPTLFSLVADVYLKQSTEFPTEQIVDNDRSPGCVRFLTSE
jgi:hypothetical protein